VRTTFLETMADHHSVSVQASIWIVGKAILERHPEVAEISMSLPNLHHWTVDLSPFGIENDREVYVSTTEPHGLIEATIRRSDPGTLRS
jgi:urate oxidase